MTRSEEIKSCCAAVYSSDAVALLLGDSYHPGGATLTRRLATLTNLRPAQRVADIASGPGATARLLTTEYDVLVDGVDFATPTVQRARETSARLGLADRIQFHVGDAERIPLPDNSVDVVVTECAFCTFPDKEAAAAEFGRIIRPGGRIGLADVTVAEVGLPDELSTLAAWVACVADAKPVTGYCQILNDAGLKVIHTESHDDALVRMIDQIEARLHLVRMTQKDVVIAAGIDVDKVLNFIDTARRAVTDGLLGYALVIAEKRSHP
ncbi:methyltransferase domain-containing protein [uncultured Mycolicibacterium sp.]|uniref:class I SAM-dependent methyltransferase n=1 Tax=uncultured Mycolicibacterium sp. TaxID=2320817 RepID=UPI0032B22B4A